MPPYSRLVRGIFETGCVVGQRDLSFSLSSRMLLFAFARGRKGTNFTPPSLRLPPRILGHGLPKFRLDFEATSLPFAVYFHLFKGLEPRSIYRDSNVFLNIRKIGPRNGGGGGREGNANVVNVGANFIVVRASLYYIRCTWTLIRVHRTRLRINDNVHFGENVYVCVCVCGLLGTKGAVVLRQRGAGRGLVRKTGESVDGTRGRRRKECTVHVTNSASPP